MSDPRVDLDRLWGEVAATFGDDRRRIEHTRRVTDYAREILQGESGADRGTVLAAAMLHDIGIPAAERKHGSAAGPYQEREGEPIARDILTRIGAEAALTDRVVALVGCHHSPGEVDTPEFDCLWDADWLVNLPAEQPEATASERLALVDRVFRTPTGRALARRLFA